jgi:hypothetical protein
MEAHLLHASSSDADFAELIGDASRSDISGWTKLCGAPF